MHGGVCVDGLVGILFEEFPHCRSHRSFFIVERFFVVGLGFLLVLGYLTERRHVRLTLGLQLAFFLHFDSVYSSFGKGSVPFCLFLHWRVKGLAVYFVLLLPVLAQLHDKFRNFLQRPAGEYFIVFIYDGFQLLSVFFGTVPLLDEIELGG